MSKSTTLIVAGCFFCFLALLCWAHLGALLEIERSSFLRFIALIAALSTSYLGVSVMGQALRVHRRARAHRELCKARTIWPGM